MTKESLLASWQDYKKSVEERIRGGLEFRYRKGEEGKVACIVEALTFWKFVMAIMSWDCKSMTAIAWIKRQEMLTVFSDSPNHLIRVIVTLESLPTMVWRKLLWKHNIDFMSFESFLRRISYSQMAAIEGCYYELYEEHKVPQVFSRWDRFWNKLSVERIFAEGYEYDKRYCNKGAMSYNLLGLDFGFNAYPKGVADDAKVVEISPLKFLSIKNHADDFVVNQEAGGRYWQLYRSIRSDYVFRPNKKVELKTHICPGFWYTIFAHLFFWIVSPAMFVSLMTIFARKPLHTIPLGVVIALGVPGLFTLLWALAASMKFVVNSKGFEWLKEFPDQHETVFMTALISGLVCVAGIVAYFAFKVLWGIFQFLSILYGPIWAVALMVVIPAYIVYKVIFRIDGYRLPKFEEYPLYLMLPLIFFAEALLVKLVLVYPQVVSQVIKFISKVIVLGIGAIVGLCIMLWEYFMAMGMVAVLIAAYIALAGLIWYIAKLDDEKQDKIFLYFERFAKYVAYAMWAVTALMLVIPFHLLLTSHSKEFYFFFALISAAVFSCYKVIVRSMRPVVKESGEFAKHVNKYMSKEMRISPSLVLKNVWLKSLSWQEKVSALKFAREIAGNLFWGGELEHKAIRALIPTMTQEILNAILEVQHMIGGYCEEHRLRIVQKMALGHGFNDAVFLAKEELAREAVLEKERERQWEKIVKTLKIIFFPLILLWKMVKLGLKVVSKLGELATTFYRLYELFNKRCPYVTQKRVLRIE